METMELSLSSIISGHHKVTYRGIPMVKCPFDYVMYQMLVSLLKPDLIIEVGTYKGGCALYLADMLDIIGKGMVHTIDVGDAREEVVKQHQRIKFFDKGWQGYDIGNASGFKNVMIIEDGSHFYEDCIGAMRKFAPLITAGNYLIIEDSVVNLNDNSSFYGGPLRAIETFLAENNNFEIDRKYCDMFGRNVTFNVNGYLKRK